MLVRKRRRLKATAAAQAEVREQAQYHGAAKHGDGEATGSRDIVQAGQQAKAGHVGRRSGQQKREAGAG